MANYIKNLENVSSNLLQRGKEYYLGNKVKNVTYENGRYQATIEGKKTYEVFVTLDKDKLTSFNCSCPYPHLCKHVVALLYSLEEKEKAKEESIYENLKKKIKTLSFNESIVEYNGLPYKINVFDDCLTRGEYLSLVEEYVAEASKNLFLFSSLNLLNRFLIFQGKKSFSEEEMQKIIDNVFSLLKEDLEGSLRFFSSFLKEEATSRYIQEYIVRKFEKKNPQLNYCLTCLSGKDFPKSLLPDFISLLARISPRLLIEKDILAALDHFEKEDSPDEVVFFMHLLLSKGREESFRKKDFDYLIEAGLLSEARNIAFSLLKSNDDFASYLRYRSLFDDKDFYGVRNQVAIAISYKKYLNSVLLFDGKEYFPELYENFSFKFLNPYDIFLAKSLIKDKKTIHILVETSHKYIKNELKKKNHNKDYFFSMLYLDFLNDDSLPYYLFLNEVLEDRKEENYMGIWLYIVKRNGLFSRIGFQEYRGVEKCL